ncbi:MAG: glycosyltransferase family 2 protein [Pikeienuella sp.]
MLLSVTPNGHLRRLGAGRWMSTGNDPQFEVLPGRFAPRFLVVELRGAAALDAAVYLGAPGAYSEAARIHLPESRVVLLAVDLRAGPARHGLRLDPTERPDQTFSLRIWRRRSASALSRLVRLRLARNPGTVANLIGPDPGLLRSVPRLRLPKIGAPGLADHLSQIWELAAIEASVDPLPPPGGPVLSVLTPVYNAKAAWLDALLASVEAQGPGIELILADDGSSEPETMLWLARHRRRPGLTVLRARENCGVAAATNRALAAARGHWVAFVDHDDALAPHALDRIRRAVAEAPNALFLYTDEVIADAALKPVSAFWKPAFDPVLLSGVNYVNHLSVFKRDRLAALGGLRPGFEGSQDYELLLRYTRGLAPEQIRHIPYPAYLWRQHAASLSHAGRDRAVAAARRALTEHFGTLIGPSAAGPAHLPDLHRIDFPKARRPKVSVIIPNKDSYVLIERVLHDLVERTAYPELELIVVDNGSTDPRVPALYRRFAARCGLRFEIRPAPFNFAAMVNRGAQLATGDALLLLNNDISVIAPGWLDEMAQCLSYPGTGIVGARLLFPDDSLQHAGVILGLGGYAGHWFYRARPDEPGPMGRLAVRNGMSVVTGACMLVSRACWRHLGGMDARRFAVAYNDVDFCARARAGGFGVVWTPFATLYHHESASRGSDLVGEKARRFEGEKTALAELHRTGDHLDPSFSPWWSRHQSRPRLVVGDALPAPRSFGGLGGVAPELEADAPGSVNAGDRAYDRRWLPRSA